MRRLLSILLLAAFGLPVIAPALALGEAPDAHLPACCRRNGAHHCTMRLPSSTNAPALSSICPRFPQPSATTPTGTSTALASVTTVQLFELTSLTPTQRAEAQRRLSRERSRHKRGPPTILL